jgi:hypothetical protein
MLFAAVYESAIGPFRRSLRRRKASGVEGEAEVDVACSKRRD